MDLRQRLRNGMRIVGPGEQDFGPIERFDDAAVYVRGRRIPFAGIERVERDRLYLKTPELWHLTEPAPSSNNLGGETRIPVLEEQLEFATREIDLGEIRVHKTVEEAEEARKGQLNREDVDVQRIRVDRRGAEPEPTRQDGGWLIIPPME